MTTLNRSPEPGAPRSKFERHTAVSAAGPSRFDATLTGDWNIGANPNGGYALAPALRAMIATADAPDPLTVTAHFLRPAVADATAVIDTTVVRAGRRTTTVTAAMSQEGRERLRVLGSFGDLDDLARPSDHDLEPPPVELPPVESCRSRRDLDQGVDLPILDSVEVLVDPAHVRGASPEAEISGWIRLRDDGPVDVVTLALFVDAFPPSVFSRYGRIGWIPTVELTLHVRRRPTQGWIRARFRTEDLAGGLLVEDGALWDSSGALVARARQLAVFAPE